MTKTQWTNDFAKFLSFIFWIYPKKTFKKAIKAYEAKNNCTIVFVQLDENGVAKKGD